MSDESRTIHHNLGEIVQGERVVKSLELVAKRMEGVEFQATPISTHQASKPTTELKVFRDPRMTWRGVVIRITTSEKSDIDAIAPCRQVTFNFERNLTEEETESFRELVRQFDTAIQEKPDVKPVMAVAKPTPASDVIVAGKLESGNITFSESRKFRILALVHDEFGKRKVKNIRERGPSYWIVESIELPKDLPTIIDDPQEFLPKDVPKADLLLSLQENPNAAQLIVDFMKLSGARALLAPVDNSEWLPEGQRNQIQRQLDAAGIESSFPRPFCVFEQSGNPYLDEFAKYFGRPVFKVRWEGDNITDVQIVRGAPCGCSIFVADKLKGTSVDESPEAAGLAHHHYPCLAAMTREPDIDDTLMHKSGFMTKDAVDKEIEPYKKKRTTYLDPSGLK